MNMTEVDISDGRCSLGCPPFKEKFKRLSGEPENAEAYRKSEADYSDRLDTLDK